MNSSSSALVQSLYSIKNRGSAAAHQAFLVAFVKHIHIKTATGKTASNRDDYRTSFLCGYSMWRKSGTHTGGMYDTYRIYYNTVYIQ